jgi:hypothetical protein
MVAQGRDSEAFMLSILETVPLLPNTERDKLGSNMTNPIEQTETRGRAQEAKEYFIAQVVDEAQRENVPLSEIERKMLHFTELYETIPDIQEVGEQFDREYDRVEYEAKITGLLKNARERVEKESADGAQHWKRAEKDLRNEDHYLVVMIKQAQQAPSGRWSGVAWGCVVGVGLVALSILATYCDMEHFIPHWMKKVPPRVWVFGGTVLFLMIWSMRGFTFGEMKLIVKGLLGMGPRSRFRKPTHEHK